LLLLAVRDFREDFVDIAPAIEDAYDFGTVINDAIEYEVRACDHATKPRANSMPCSAGERMFVKYSASRTDFADDGVGGGHAAGACVIGPNGR
jgi:hypothetical protein